MTAGNDVRPVTASGSVRPSDVQHHRNLRQAELEYDDLQRRQARTTVLEEIEDFEHKLGWRMRTNLGPRWEEKRYLELEEERTMGLKKAPLVRPSWRRGGGGAVLRVHRVAKTRRYRGRGAGCGARRADQ